MNTNNKKSPFSILFVDDEEKSRKYFEKALKDQFTILTADSVKAAEDIVKEHHQQIAVVITDQRMPGNNGVKLLNFLHQNYPHIIRLLTTGYSDLTEAIEAVNKGEIFRYIQKPWDFNLLKTELIQALELFEIRLELNKLLNEKMVVRRKIAKVDRLRSLILLGRTLNFIRFSEISAANFIKHFAVMPVKNVDSEDWRSFEMGSHELFEINLMNDVIDKVYTAIPHLGNYNFDSIINSNQIEEKIRNAANINYSNLNIKVDGNIPDLEINDRSFSAIIEKLLSQIPSSMANQTSIEVKAADGNILMDLKMPEICGFKDNIFAINTGKLETSHNIDLLICYLLIGHHGGTIDINHNNQNITIKIPSRPSSATLPKLSEQHLEDMILSVMMNS